MGLIRVTYNASSTWIVPAGVTSAIIECRGSGGDGGSGSLTMRGGGGKGGAYARSTPTNLAPGNTHRLFVGTGGSSTFRHAEPSTNEIARAAAGLAGGNGTALAQGSGATQQTETSTGDVIYEGGNGASGSAAGGGGGGGGAGSNGNGASGSGTTGGGGGAGGGQGGSGAGLTGTGSLGSIPGGAGGGGGTSGSGGSGARGRVIVQWDSLTDEVTTEDAAELIAQFTREFDDEAMAADDVVLTVEFFRDLMDEVASVDVTSFQAGKILEDEAVALDLVHYALGKELADQVLSSDQMVTVSQFVRSLGDEASAVDQVSKAVTLNLVDTTGVADSGGGVTKRPIYIFGD